MSIHDVARVRAMMARRGGAAVGGAVGGGCGNGMPPFWDQGYGWVSQGAGSFNPGIAVQNWMQHQGAMAGDPQAQAATAMVMQNPGNQLGFPGQNGMGYGNQYGNQYGFNGQWDQSYPGCGPIPGPSTFCNLYPQARGLQKVELGFTTAPIAAGATGGLLVQPPIPVQISNVRIPSDIAGSFSIVTITSGVQELLLGGAVPARLATEVSICGVSLAHTTVVPGVGVNLTFQNTTAPGGPPLPVSGSLTVVAAYC